MLLLRGGGGSKVLIHHTFLISENPRPPLGRNKRSSLRSRFGHFTANDKQRFAVNGFTFDLSAHIWDLKFAGDVVAHGCHVCFHSPTYFYFS